MAHTYNSSTTTPPPSIGKIGPYTVFVTPTPKPSPSPAAPSFVAVPILKTAHSPSPSPPVQLPPIQYPSSPSTASPFSAPDGAILYRYPGILIRVSPTLGRDGVELICHRKTRVQIAILEHDICISKYEIDRAMNVTFAIKLS